MSRSPGRAAAVSALAAFVAVFVVVSVTACGGIIDDTDNPSDAAKPGITFVEEYGFCGVRCYSVLDVSPSGAGHVVVRERRNGAVRLDRRFTLSAAEHDHLLELAAAATSRTWDALYGCPDCVDQGRFELTVHAGADTHTTVLDPTQHPAYFDALIGELRTVLAREKE